MATWNKGCNTSTASTAVTTVVVVITGPVTCNVVDNVCEIGSVNILAIVMTSADCSKSTE